MNTKKIIHKTHLILGLLSGLVVFIISVTGCIYAFQEEIKDIVEDYRHIPEQSSQLIPPSRLREIASVQLPGKTIHSITYSRNEAAEIAYYSFSPSYYYKLFVHPYNGKVIHLKNEDDDFFRIVLMGHYYLWLPPEIGQPVIASATLIFVILIISGLYLWWPNKKGKTAERLSIRWNARWRRKNYDLHRVLGFYASFVALVLAFTGLIWGFEWFAKSMYWTITGGKQMKAYYDVYSDTTISNPVADPLDKIFFRTLNDHPGFHSIEVHVPENNKSSIAVNVNLEEGTFYTTDFRYYDQYSLKELEVDHIWGRSNKANTGDKLIRMNYDIHTGAIAGLAGKTLAFFISLLCASLPVTGFILWWGRKNKKEKKSVKKDRYKLNTKYGAA